MSAALDTLHDSVPQTGADILRALQVDISWAAHQCADRGNAAAAQERLDAKLSKLRQQLQAMQVTP